MNKANKYSNFEKFGLYLFGIFALVFIINSGYGIGLVVKSQLAGVIVHKDVENINKPAPNRDERQRIFAIVLPHHNLVAKVRKDMLDEIALKYQSPDTIIVISPNHFNAGNADLQTTSRVWQLSSGAMAPDNEVIRQLASAGVIVNDNSFINEHGIYNVLPDLKDAFPQAKVVPIIIKPETDRSKLDNLIETLNTSCKQCMLVTSVDFSHYQPALLAQLHDSLTLRGLINGNLYKLLHNAEVDSPESLYLLVRWAKLHNTISFYLYKHTNADTLLNKPDSTENTTHIFGWYKNGNPPYVHPSVTFDFAGDFMFARGIHKKFNTNPELVLKQLGKRFFWGTDGFVVNLEGAIAKSDTVNIEPYGSFKFVFPKKVAKLIADYKINYVSLANNHAVNNGKGGVQITRNVLHDYGVVPFGGPGPSDVDKIVIIYGDRLNIVLIGVHALYATPNIIDLIHKYASDENNRVVVMPHWGIEYSKKHNKAQEKMAHDWIDAGADLVVGSHPHVIQDVEVYKGVPIFYSLGNFLFDQTEQTVGRKGVQTGLTIHGEFTDKALKIFALPIQISNYKPQLIIGGRKDNILKKLYSTLPKSVIIKTESGKLLNFKNNQ